MVPIVALSARDALTIAVVAVLSVFAVIVIGSGVSERRRGMVPPALRPGPSDEQLERRILDRYLAVGAVLTLFMAVFLPVVLLLEDSRLEKSAATFLDESVERGRAMYGSEGLVALNCAACHGPNGEGTITPTKNFDGESAPFLEPPLAYIYARYKAAGRNDEEITQLIRDAIERGRPGTPMPTWGIVYGGPLNAQQVDDLINFIKSIQEEAPGAKADATGQQLFEANCQWCHGTNGSGRLEYQGKEVRTIAPPLDLVFERLNEEQIRQTLENGRVNMNRTSMPAWAHLGDEAIEKLIQFIQSIQRGA